MNGVVDATCSRCGQALRWDVNYPRLCETCLETCLRQPRQESAQVTPAEHEQALPGSAGKAPGERLRRRVVAAILSLLLLALAACDLGPTGSNVGAAGFSPAPQSPHQDHRWMMYCPQEPGPQYPQADFTAANAFIASSLDAAVVPNVDGISVFVTPITSRTFDETASGDFTMQVPPTDPVPPAPTLQPVPTVDPQHLYDSKAKQQQIVDANTKAIRDYQAALGKEQAQLQQVRAQVKTQTDSLRRFIPPADPDPKDASDWGCVAKASDRLGGVSGQRWLVLSSAMDETEWVDRLPGINLAGVKVRVLFYFCRDSGTCRYKQSTWRSAFARAGVTDLAFADAQSSALLPPLFGPGQ